VNVGQRLELVLLASVGVVDAIGQVADLQTFAESHWWSVGQSGITPNRPDRAGMASRQSLARRTTCRPTRWVAPRFLPAT